jgi:hypothetical protein
MAAGGHNLLMVEPIKPCPMRQTTARGWQMASDIPLPGVCDDRWWCIGHMVRDTDRRPMLTLLFGGEGRKLLVW